MCCYSEMHGGVPSFMQTCSWANCKLGVDKLLPGEHVSGLRSLLGVSSMQSAPRLLRSLTRRCGAAATSASETHETSRPLTHMLASTSESTAAAAALGAHEQPAQRQVAWQSPAWLQTPRNLWPCNGGLLELCLAHKQEQQQQQQHGQRPWQQLEARRWLRSSTSMTAADSGSETDQAKGVKGPAVHSPLQDLFGSTGTQTPATSPLQGGAGGLYRPSGTGTGPVLPTPRPWAWYDEDDERKEQRKERSGLALRCECTGNGQMEMGNTQAEVQAWKAANRPAARGIVRMGVDLP